MLIPFKDNNPTGIYPLITIFFIVANVVIFVVFRVGLWQSYQTFVWEFGAIPWEILHNSNLPNSPNVPPPVTILTSMFLHAGLIHLGGNMLYMWIFGNNVEDYLGHLGFIGFYLACGIVASLFHIIFNSGSTAPMVGASGAIAGVLGAYLVLYPRARIKTLAFLFIFIAVIDIPASVVLIMWIFIQVSNGLYTSSELGGGVAWWAHIGGFAAGFILIRVFPKRKGFRKRVRQYH